VRSVRATSALAVLLGLGLALLPAPAYAHGIGGDGDRSVLGFVSLGVEHMLLGWDHLLFVAGCLLVAQDWRRAAKLITAFALGHSTTLIAATLAGWQVDAFVVDLVIAFSVVFIGLIAVTKRTPEWNILGALVFGLGLVHGLGLSTRLQGLDLEDDGLIWRVLAFNVGVEVGQLTAILAITALAALVSLIIGTEREPVLRRIALVGVLVGGVAAVGVNAYLGPEDEPTREEAIAEEVEAADTGPSCEVADRTEQFPPMGGHVTDNFYEPDDETPIADFGHSVADGYVAVLYPPEMDTDDLEALREFVTGPDGQGVLAGPSTDQDGYRVHNAYFTLTCTEADVDATKEFTAAWFESIR
jgi:hydrogenase/urease accessory protein HupE